MSDTKTLIEQLKQYDIAYSEGDSPVSDKDYDTLYRKALAADPGNAYFASVGSDVRGGKEKLPYVMGSLDQVYDQKDWDNWVKTYDLSGKNVVISDKQDGISVMLIYRHGKFEKAYSRGNGMEGADISRHVRNVPSVPMNLTVVAGENAYFAIRAELIMPISTFERKYYDQYKNPRGMAAGCFNASTTEDGKLRDMQCITYQVVAYAGVDSEFFPVTTKGGELKALSELGFMVTPFDTVAADKLNDVVLRSLVAEAKRGSGTELDGVVVTIDNYNDMDSQRRSKTTLNPEHSIKYKVSLDSVQATVVDVLYEVSKSAFYKPRVQIKPIGFGGVTITYATGFNGKFIHDNGIGPGAEVMITRSGDVIPFITSTVKSVTPKMPSGDYEWNDNGVELVVTDPDHPEVKFKQVLSFVESLQVELLKESSLTEAFTRLKLASLPFHEIIHMLFDLTDGEWVQMVGQNGNKIAVSLRRRGESMTYETFLGSVPYLGFGFGVRKAKALLSQISYDDLLNATVRNIESLDGFDTKTAGKIIAGLPQADALLNLLLSDGYVTIIKEVKTSELKGLSVVFTGFRDADLEKAIESAGGKIGSSVSAKTTYLLTVDPKSNSGKAKKARDLGVKVWSPEQFKDEYNL
jgi:DNA ligase (NAD+)